MDFLSQNLRSDLEAMLMEQWNAGYNAGVSTCIAGLEMLLEQSHIRPTDTTLIKNIIEGFKQGIV